MGGGWWHVWSEGHWLQFIRHRNLQDVGPGEICIQILTLAHRASLSSVKWGELCVPHRRGPARSEHWSVLIPLSYPSPPLPPFSARTVFLRLASLLVLLFSLWNQITCGGNAEAEECKTCGYNYKELPVRWKEEHATSWVPEGEEKLGGSKHQV